MSRMFCLFFCAYFIMGGGVRRVSLRSWRGCFRNREFYFFAGDFVILRAYHTGDFVIVYFLRNASYGNSTKVAVKTLENTGFAKSEKCKL